MEKEKEVEREAYVSFQLFSKRKNCYSTRLNSSYISRQMLSESVSVVRTPFLCFTEITDTKNWSRNTTAT